MLLRAKDQYFHTEPDLGWSQLEGIDLEVVEVPGNHMTLLSKPQVADLAVRLQQHLDSA